MLFQLSYCFFFVLLQTMNTGYFYQLLLCLASGSTLCLLIGCAFFLFRRHRQYQFQRAFAVVLLLLSVGFFNNFLVLSCRNLDSAEFLNLLLILYDYVVVGGYMFFVVSLVFPDRYNAVKLSMFLVPYVIAIVFFAITHNPIIYNVVQIYTFVVSSVLLVWLELSIKKYNSMLRDNVANIEFFDLRWGSILVALLYVIQLVWAIESMSNKSWFSVPTADTNLLFDTLWCIITIAYVLFFLRKIVQQQVFVVPPQEESGESGDVSSDDYYKVLNNSDVDSQIKEKKYYLDPALTLQKLATHLGTNRQYLSNFINREKQKTFYEYINEFRLEEAKSLLDNWDSERGRSMEDIASLSGFNSYSTFLRSFVKKYGETPSQYLKRS